jgi:UDP-N-acetylmuramyl tripeptide synthase
VLEAVSALPLDAASIERWRTGVRGLSAALGWPAPELAARVHPGGATLVLSAPLDQLFAATEVNEWAWQRAVGAHDGFHAPGHPASWDEPAALDTLTRLARGERAPALRALVDAARAHGLEACIDDDTLSLGEGRWSRAWPTSAPPAPDAVPWSALQAIPKALVTGSNGKTTSVRLLAAALRAQGLHVGHSCTDGVFVDGIAVASGDWSGPAGARSVLRHPAVEAAVLETARGGILRRGLAVTRADVAVVTGISADHFGEYGVHDLDDLAEVKLTVARAIDARGLLVLNADDAILRCHAALLTCPLGWFARDHAHPLLEAHRAGGGRTCGVQAGELLLSQGDATRSLGPVEAMPLTLGGLAGYNIANLAGAALAAAALGVPAATLAALFARFGSEHADNSGRLQRWRFGRSTVLLDYAHNPEGLDALLGIAQRLRGDGRLGLLLGQAGNRDDDAVRALAATAARHRPDRVVLKDIAGFLRGRAPGEIAGVLRAALLRGGVDASAIETVLDEAQAACVLVGWARDGDVVVLPTHGTQARERVCRWLDALLVAAWRPGQALPELPATPSSD